MSEEKYGFFEGDVCGRRQCHGVIATHPSENCSCHINPPCGSCTAPRNFCPTCGWEEADDEPFNDHIINVNKDDNTIRTWVPRPLDTSKIDYRNHSHTHFSMIKEGCYPEGTTRAEVEEVVRGTFGGRFKSFGNGRFEYIAYTD